VGLVDRIRLDSLVPSEGVQRPQPLHHGVGLSQSLTKCGHLRVEVGPHLLDHGVVPGAGLGPLPHRVRRLAAVTLAAERAHIYEVVGEALGHFRNELLDQVEEMIAERVEYLRADVNKGDEGEVVTRFASGAGTGSFH